VRIDAIAAIRPPSVRERKTRAPAAARRSGCRRGSPATAGALERYEQLCREVGAEPADVALAWLLQRPGVTAPIIGPRTMDQLTTSVRALEVTLDAETVARLDEIWPGPGGEAPEAYAW